MKTLRRFETSSEARRARTGHGPLLALLAVLMAAALLATATAVAAQDTTDVMSDRQLRQRVNYALDRFENIRDELDATRGHLDVLAQELNARIQRDSLRRTASLGLDSVRIETLAGEPVEHIDLEVGEVSETITYAAYRNGRRVGCLANCESVELATYGTTEHGVEVVLVGHDGEWAAMPKDDYEAAYLTGPTDHWAVQIMLGAMAFLLIGSVVHLFVGWGSALTGGHRD